ncbi:MAG: hypothetical protein ABIR30_13375 [Chitinophagaceae bacterium]
MNSYILLRDNKESTALSLEDLQGMGLRSTDLVWVECQSVGWRNPHEIAELKNLVNAGAKTVEKPPEHLSLKIEQSIAPEQPEQPKKKLVHVELPAENTPATEYTAPLTGTSANELHKYAGLAASAKTSVTEEEPVIDTKYSRPLAEIKELYVKSLEQKSRRKLIEIKLPAPVKKGLFYAGLILSGALLMYLFKKEGNKRSIAAFKDAAQPQTQTASADTTTAAFSTVMPAGNPETVMDEVVNTIDPGTDKATKDITVKTNLEKIKSKPDPNDRVVLAQPAEEKIIPGVKELPATKPASKENISAQVSVKANDYLTGSFGGIRNLEMSVQNDSKFLLDNVTVELRYLNPEGVIVKTQNIQFQSVYPGETETILVKKTNRGVKVSYKIVRIESKEVNNSTSSL